VVRISNYGVNVCWCHRVDCVRIEERQRIKQWFELQTASSRSHHAKLCFWYVRLTPRGVPIKL
jgi:hypothetical protein